MYKLLVKLFIKDNKNTKDPLVRAKYGSLAGNVGITVNIILFIFKIIAGIISGSIAIITDGINNLTDASSSIITLVGFKMSVKPADEDHPFGHQRIEYLTGVIVSFIILFIGIFLGIESVKKIIEPSMPKPDVFVYIILGVSIVGKLWLSIFNRKMGIGDRLLIQDAFNLNTMSGLIEFVKNVEPLHIINHVMFVALIYNIMMRITILKMQCMRFDMDISIANKQF